VARPACGLYLFLGRLARDHSLRQTRSGSRSDDLGCDSCHKVGWVQAQSGEPLDQLDNVQAPSTSLGLADHALTHGQSLSELDLGDGRSFACSTKLAQKRCVLFCVERAVHG
jgi:hypothetical protein